MWNELERPWQLCFEEAWKAYCTDSLPIGAAIINSKGDVISTGRNMISIQEEESGRITNSKLAHAEMNAIYSSQKGLSGATIYSTMEPCVMCFGAIVMNGITEVHYAARDGLAGGTNLSNDYIESRNISIANHHEFLEVVQLAIKTDFILRFMSRRAETLLAYWEHTCPIGVVVGKKWFESNKFEEYKVSNRPIELIIDEIEKEYELYCQLS